MQQPVSQYRFACRACADALHDALAAPVLERVDAAGVNTRLETFAPGNQSFYPRPGYRVLGCFDEPTIGASYRLMAQPHGARS